MLLSPLRAPVSDVSPVNAGALDGFLHTAARPEHFLVFLAAGLLCAGLSARRALATLGTLAAALAVGAALGLANVDLPFADAGVFAGAVIVAAGVVLGQRLPWPVALVGVAAIGLCHSNAHVYDRHLIDARNALSYAATMFIAAVGLAWVGLGLGFMAVRSRAGERLARSTAIVSATVVALALLRG